MSEEIQNSAPVESAGESGFNAGLDSSADGENSLDSTEDIVAALEGMGGEAEPSENVTDDAEAEPVEAKPEAEHPAVPLPEGWDDAMWSGLTPEVQAHINERVQAHAQALAAKEKAQQDLIAKQNEYTVQTNAQLQQALAVMKQIVNAEYGGIDWAAIAQSDPAAYVQLQQQYAQRMSAIQGIQKGITAQAEQIRQARAAEAKKHLDSEYAQVLPEVQALMGAGFNGKQFASEVAQYLTSQGVPSEAINGIENGYELKLAVKAMLFDRMQKARSTAAAKVADAPKVAAPNGGAGQENGGMRGSKAMRAFRSNPNSTEALANVLSLL